MFLDAKPLHPSGPRRPIFPIVLVALLIVIGIMAWYVTRPLQEAPKTAKPAATNEVSSLQPPQAIPFPPPPELESETVMESGAFQPPAPVDERLSATGAQAGEFIARPISGSGIPDASAHPADVSAPDNASPAGPTFAPINRRRSSAAVETTEPGVSAPTLLSPASSTSEPSGTPTSEPPPAPGSRAPAETGGAPDTPDTPGSDNDSELSNLFAEAIREAGPPRPAAETPPPATRPVTDTFETQLALDRLGFSSGPIDGLSGPQTGRAIAAFQEQQGLIKSGLLDGSTRARLRLAEPVYTNYIVTLNDLTELRPLPASWLGKSQQDRLAYQTLTEKVAEIGHCHPNFVRKLNPYIDWNNVAAGDVIKIPNAVRDPVKRKAARIRIHLAERVLQALNENDRIVGHFPCSIARRVEARPVGELKVEVLVEEPNYTFDPKRFPDTPEGRSLTNKLIVPPGPNNPVGTAWIGLDRPGYGIHGTPEPEKVGRTESLGCFRLANWNAEFLVQLVWIGMPVEVLP